MAHQLGGACEVDVAPGTARTKAPLAKSTQLVELVLRSPVELVAQRSTRYVVRIEGAELEVGEAMKTAFDERPKPPEIPEKAKEKKPRPPPTRRKALPTEAER